MQRISNDEYLSLVSEDSLALWILGTILEPWKDDSGFPRLDLFLFYATFTRFRSCSL